MVKKSYENSEYEDPDNIYTYPNSSVLINKQNEQDAQKQRELEYRKVASQALRLVANPIEVYAVKDILAIHRFLFQDLYWWAGQYRKVNISKQGNAFMAMQSFGSAEQYMNSLLTDYHQNANSKAELIQHLAKILDNENYFHPFREGNGRTQREVIRVLGLMKGYDSEINVSLDDEIYNLYMDGTVYGDVKVLEMLFEKILVKL
jgi:cell filamentation protein